MPVVPCIKPCRKAPVVDKPKLWKSPTRVLTRLAAAQRESAFERSHLREGATIRAETGLRQLRWKPVTLGALASPALATIFRAYLQSRPNTAGAALTGPFDGERAFADLKTLVSCGPRSSGSQALERAREFIIAELRAAGASVTEDKFTAKTPIGSIPMTNIVAKITGASPSIVIIGGHYHTKRMATPFVGANDGGSSGAFLLLRNMTTPLVLLAGERAGNRAVSPVI